MDNVKKVLDYISIIIFSFGFILTSAFISIIPIASDNSYYMQQYIKNGVNNNLPYSLEQLEEITKSITNYLFHGAESMQIAFDGKNVFSSQAISHMADVKVLFVDGSIIGYICIALSIISLIYIIYRVKHIKKIFRKINYITYGVFLLLIVAIGIYAAVDFDDAFVNFHHLIFPDPEKFNNAFFPWNDTLINILTIDFFFDIFFAIIIRVVAIFIVYFIIIQCLYGKTYIKIKNSFNKLKNKRCC